MKLVMMLGGSMLLLFFIAGAVYHVMNYHGAVSLYLIGFCLLMAGFIGFGLSRLS